MRRIPEIVFGFLIATALWSCIVLWQSQKTVPNSQVQPAKTEQQYAKSAGAVVEQEQHSKGGQKSNWYDTFLNHTPDWFVAIFTALLSFVTYRLVSTTGGLRASTDKLWEAGERQIELARETAAAQSRDMEAATSAANQANELNRQNAARDRRPWLGVADVRFVRPLLIENGINTSIGVTVKNTGRSPALRVRIISELYLPKVNERLNDFRRPFQDKLAAVARFGGSAVFPSDALTEMTVANVQPQEIGKSPTNAGDVMFPMIRVGVSYESEQGEKFVTFANYMMGGIKLGVTEVMADELVPRLSFCEAT